MCGKKSFCCIHLRQTGLRAWLKLKYNHIPNPPPFVRDVTNVGHYGNGDVELAISNRTELEQAEELIRQSYYQVRGNRQ